MSENDRYFKGIIVVYYVHTLTKRENKMENLQNVYVGLMIACLLVAVVFGVVGLLPVVAQFAFNTFAIMGLVLWPFLVITDLIKAA